MLLRVDGGQGAHQPKLSDPLLLTSLSGPFLSVRASLAPCAWLVIKKNLGGGYYRVNSSYLSGCWRGGESDLSPGKAALTGVGGSRGEEEVGARLAGDCQLRGDDSGSSSASPT